MAAHRRRAGPCLSGSGSLRDTGLTLEQTGLALGALGAGFVMAAPVLPVVLDRIPPRHVMAVGLTVEAGAYFLLFHATSLTTALPAAAALGMAGSVLLAVPPTALPREVRNAVLGRVGAVFLTAEAAATLLGAIVGPFVAQAAGIPGVASGTGTRDWDGRGSSLKRNSRPHASRRVSCQLPAASRIAG